jgi:hypothetical protein
MIVTLTGIDPSASASCLARQALAHLFIICTSERNDSPNAWQTTRE